MLIFFKILLVLFCVLMGLILVILFTPIFLSFSSSKKKADDIFFVCYFIHRAIFLISYNISRNKYKIVILNLLVFKTIEKKPETDLTEKIVRSETEQEKDEPAISEVEQQSFEEYSSKKDESETDNYGKRQSDLDHDDKNEKDNDEDFDTYEPDTSSPKAYKISDSETKGPDLFKEQKDIDFKKDIESSGDRTLRSGFFKNLKMKILAFKDLSQFVLDQKKIAKKVIFWLKRIIIRIVRVISFDDFSLYLKAGFDDPYITGIVYGYFIGIKKVINLNKHSSVGFQFEPVFNKNDSITIYGSIRIRTSLARMCWPLFIAVFTFPYISAFILFRRIKKRKKVISK